MERCREHTLSYTEPKDVFVGRAENRERGVQPNALGSQVGRHAYVRWVAPADALVLVALVSASFLDRRDLVSVLGPVHGGNVLLLVALSTPARPTDSRAGGFPDDRGSKW